MLKKGRNVIFDIDWQGTQKIKEKKLNFNLITIFILPPSKKTLLNRLAERENNDQNVIQERMNKFNHDVKRWIDYDYVVINDDLEICFNEIKNIIKKKLNNEIIKFDREKITKQVDNLLN